MLLPNGSVRHVVCPLPDQESKYVMYERVAREIKQTGANAVIFINEMWTLPLAQYDGRRPALSPNRREALGVVVATSQGKSRMHITPFTRGWFGRIRLQATVAEDGQGYNFLNPIWKVWGITPSEEERK